MVLRDDSEAPIVTPGVGAGLIESESMSDQASAAATSAGEVPDTAVRSQWQLFRRRFLRHKLAVLSLAILVTLILCALFASVIAPYELNPSLTSETLLGARKGPTMKHWFGTDELGRDQLTRILYAGRISLTIGLTVALASTIIGTTVGAIAGFYGRWLDTVLMRMTDLFLIVPQLAVLMMAQKGITGKVLPIVNVRLSPTIVIIGILSFLFWQYIARVVRAQVLSLKEKEFVEAARASGARSSGSSSATSSPTPSGRSSSTPPWPWARRS